MNTTQGLCECGCGRSTNIATQNCTQSGAVKGKPQRFIKGHQRVKAVKKYEPKLCECGCGEKTNLATVTQRGYTKGQPVRFISGHSSRVNRTVRPLAERFWEKVNKNGPMPSEVAVREHPEIEGTQCWEWTAFVHPTEGYGIFTTGLEPRQTHAHRVAWFLEIGRWPEPFGLHKCDNRKCVRFSHLFEGDHEANSTDKIKKHRGNNPNGERTGMAKLTDAQVIAMREDRVRGVPNVELVKLYNVALPTVEGILGGKSWQHITRGVSLTTGEQSHSTKLTDKQVIDIRTAFANGTSVTTLAEEYAVDRTTIYRANNGETYKNIAA